MNYYASALTALLFSGSCFAQTTSPQVYAAAGNSVQNGTLILQQTIGEPLTSSYTAGTPNLTQGFHQPILSTVGTEEWTQHLVSLYPNPATETATITVPADFYTSYVIYDAAGRKVAEGQPEGSAFQITVADWQTGVYKLTLQGKNESVLTFIKH